MYYRARWYDSASGRFISEDPIGLAGGINLYGYVGNDPVRLTDPTGNNPLWIALARGALIGGISGGLWNAAYQGKDIYLSYEEYKFSSKECNKKIKGFDWGKVANAAIAGATTGAPMGGLGHAMGPASSAIETLLMGGVGVEVGMFAQGATDAFTDSMKWTFGSNGMIANGAGELAYFVKGIFKPLGETAADVCEAFLGDGVLTPVYEAVTTPSSAPP